MKALISRSHSGARRCAAAPCRRAKRRDADLRHALGDAGARCSSACSRRGACRCGDRGTRRTAAGRSPAQRIAGRRLARSCRCTQSRPAAGRRCRRAARRLGAAGPDQFAGHAPDHRGLLGFGDGAAARARAAGSSPPRRHCPCRSSARRSGCAAGRCCMARGRPAGRRWDASDSRRDGGGHRRPPAAGRAADDQVGVAAADIDVTRRAAAVGSRHLAHGQRAEPVEPARQRAGEARRHVLGDQRSARESRPAAAPAARPAPAARRSRSPTSTRPSPADRAGAAGAPAGDRTRLRRGCRRRCRREAHALGQAQAACAGAAPAAARTFSTSSGASRRSPATPRPPAWRRNRPRPGAAPPASRRRPASVSDETITTGHGRSSMIRSRQARPSMCGMWTSSVMTSGWKSCSMRQRLHAVAGERDLEIRLRRRRFGRAGVASGRNRRRPEA